MPPAHPQFVSLTMKKAAVAALAALIPGIFSRQRWKNE
jgi:hypothetical protein